MPAPRTGRAPSLRAVPRPIMLSRRKLSATVLITYLLIPAGVILQLAWQPAGWNIGWVFNVTVTAAVIGFFFAVCAWNWLSASLRWVLATAVVAAAAHGGIYSALLALVVVVASARLTLGRAGQVPRHSKNEPIALASPFPPGRFCVCQGGNSARFNHHFNSRSQRFALDISQLGIWGERARGLYPARLDRYHIFGTPVLSPCDGVVTFATGEQPDEIPPQRNRTHLAGNFIMIAAGEPDLYVCLAHLQHGSLQVRTGDRVHTGQPIARVGNSGNTTEPHLHLQAKRGGSPDSLLDGEAIPMLIQGRFLRRNQHLAATWRRPER